jgi:hypothetical protein
MSPDDKLWAEIAALRAKIAEILNRAVNHQPGLVERVRKMPDDAKRKLVAYLGLETLQRYDACVVRLALHESALAQV